MRKLRGTNRQDTLKGGNGPDLLLGLGGADVLKGGHGADTLKAGTGNDRLVGGSGNDKLFGEAGNDRLQGEKGNDRLVGGSGNDRLEGGPGRDAINGGNGQDTALGGAGDDTIDGGSGGETATSGDIAKYASLITSAQVAYDPLIGAWTVSAGAEGRDTLREIEFVQGAGSGRFLLAGAGGFATIQAAVDAARDGDTVLVAQGIYTEQVVINGLDNFSLLASGAVTIASPSDLRETARSSTDRELNAVVSVLNSSNVSISNIDIDGLGRGNSIDEGGGTGPAQFNGLLYRNASGAVTNVDIFGVRADYGTGLTVEGTPVLTGPVSGVGLRVDNDTPSPFTITGGSIRDFQSVGAFISGATLHMSDMAITGSGTQPEVWQGGVRVINSTGEITGFQIAGLGYTGPAVYAVGITIAGNATIDITGNTIVGTNSATTAAKSFGIAVFDEVGANSGGLISGNTVSFTDIGIEVFADVTPAGVLVQNNIVTSVDTTDIFGLGLNYAPDTSFPTEHTATGTSVYDWLQGGTSADNFDGGGGGDVILGEGGADQIDAGIQDDDDMDIIRFNSFDDFGDQITDFDSTGAAGEYDVIQFDGALNDAFDDLVNDDILTLVLGSVSATVNVAANLDATYEGLGLAGTFAGEGVLSSELTNAALVATAFNAEFAISASVGQDAVLVINDTDANDYSVWQYVESGATPEIQTVELTLIAHVLSNGISVFGFTLG